MLTFNAILERHNIKAPVRYGISHRLAFPDLDPLKYLELLFQTRSDVVQWREKDLSAEENRVFVRQGVELAKQTSKLFLVNTFLELAVEECADGAHLTSTQDLNAARQSVDRLSPEAFLLGKSVHTLREAELVEREGGDYVLLGPIFAPLSKGYEGPVLGCTALREAMQMLFTPVVAVGGIDESNLQEVFKTGVSGAAGISWVHRELEQLMESGA